MQCYVSELKSNNECTHCELRDCMQSYLPRATTILDNVLNNPYCQNDMRSNSTLYRTTKILTRSNSKHRQTTNLMQEKHFFVIKGYKTLQEKEKMLYCLSVFSPFRTLFRNVFFLRVLNPVLHRYPF